MYRTIKVRITPNAYLEYEGRSYSGEDRMQIAPNGQRVPCWHGEEFYITENEYKRFSIGPVPTIAKVGERSIQAAKDDDNRPSPPLRGQS
ncbi:MAG: hypothetical protein GY869_07620 [Planctomycetes bacterium]|nr:hypothetical protein [Planctomycetota bacterium]